MAKSCCCVVECNPVRKTWTFWLTVLVLSLGLRAALASIGEFLTGYLIIIVITGRYVLYPWYLIWCKKKKSDCMDNASKNNDGSAVNVCCDDRSLVCSNGDDMEHQKLKQPEKSHHQQQQEKEKEQEQKEEDAQIIVEPIVSSDPLGETQDIVLEQNNNNKHKHIATTTSTTTTRVYFLDNVKSFLTAIVVTHHISCAFGACGRLSWFLIVGMGNSSCPLFDLLLETFVTINQAYFMPLFFFISAYFVPASYEKKGIARFFQAKKKRLYIPAMFVTFFIVPGCIALGYYISDNPIHYFPMPGPTWFLFWLLLLNWCYGTLCQAAQQHAAEVARNNNNNPSHLDVAVNAGSNNDIMISQSSIAEPAAAEIVSENKTTNMTTKTPFPSTLKRMGYGAGVCGFLMLLVAATPGTFATMPISTGSLTCNLFMYGMGVMAHQNEWLTSSLPQQMDLHPILLACFVSMEAIGFCFLLPMAGPHSPVGILIAIVAFIFAGMFTLDMSLLVLIVFQRWMNFENGITRFFSRAAYTVFLIHPGIICGVTAAYIQVYNQLPAAASDPIVFGGPHEDIPLPPPGQGGEDYFFLGWLIVTSMSHLLVWPISYGLTQLPYLRGIL